MKTELKEKAEFFAQYLNQFRLKSTTETGMTALNEFDQWDLEDQYLAVSPLSSIQDENLEELFNMDCVFDFVKSKLKSSSLSENKDMIRKKINHLCQFSDVADYLRSNGFAVQWRKYSIDDLITKKYIQVREP